MSRFLSQTDINEINQHYNYPEIQRMFMSNGANTQQSRNPKKRTLDQCNDDEKQMENRNSTKRVRRNDENTARHLQPDEDEVDDEEEEKLLIGGALSPRMLYRLQQCAQLAYDISCQEVDYQFRRYQAEHDFFAYLSGYLPVRFRKKMFKSFWMGYVQCFGAMAAILSRNELPDVHAVERELAKSRYNHWYTDYYLGNGGRIEFALDAIIKRSREESLPQPRGDGSFFDDDTQKQEHDALPEMPRYDFLYEMVWDELCLDSGWDCMWFELSFGGPYEEREEDEEDQDDDLVTWHEKLDHRAVEDLRREARNSKQK